MKQIVSIIIPTFNEAENINLLLKYVNKHFPVCEIIVTDGGSTDDTVSIADGLAKVVISNKGRAVQMNTGANAASGDVLWFLHADCIPAPKSIDLIIDALKDERIVGGGFRWGLSSSEWYYRYITYLAHIKNKVRQNLYGDMGIFVRADIFKKLKGYTEIPFLEDMDFCRKVKTMGKIVIIDDILWSSDRKLIKNGPVRTFIKNDIIKMAFRLGFSPEYLMKFYYGN